MADNFKEFYKLPSLASTNLDDFTKKVLIHIARTQGRLGKGGIPNLHASSLVVLQDWRDGKFQGWTLPKSSKASIDKEEKEQKNSKGSVIAPPSANIEQTTVVKEWSKEFDLDSLFADVFGDK